MPDLKEITSLTVEHELHTCPACGYTLGFHTSFVSAGTGRDTPVPSPPEGYRVVLICPECGARYDVGWRIPLPGSGSRFVKAPVKSGACIPHGSPAACLPTTSRHDEDPPA